MFHPLGKEQLRSIVDIQLGYLRKRLADRDIELTLDDAAMDLLGEAGFDPVYGARPLKRAIQQQVENPLAQRILQRRVWAGSEDQGDGEGRGHWSSRIAVGDAANRLRPELVTAYSSGSYPVAGSPPSRLILNSAIFPL